MTRSFYYILIAVATCLCGCSSGDDSAGSGTPMIRIHAGGDNWQLPSTKAGESDNWVGEYVTTEIPEEILVWGAFVKPGLDRWLFEEDGRMNSLTQEYNGYIMERNPEHAAPSDDNQYYFDHDSYTKDGAPDTAEPWLPDADYVFWACSAEIPGKGTVSARWNGTDIDYVLNSFPEASDCDFLYARASVRRHTTNLKEPSEVANVSFASDNRFVHFYARTVFRFVLDDEYANVKRHVFIKKFEIAERNSVDDFVTIFDKSNPTYYTKADWLEVKTASQWKDTPSAERPVFFGYFRKANEARTNAVIRTTYEIYDGVDTEYPTREECVAKNDIVIASTKAGTLYPYTILVKPKFLYVLSDNDHEMRDM